MQDTLILNLIRSHLKESKFQDDLEQQSKISVYNIALFDVMDIIKIYLNGDMDANTIKFYSENFGE